MNAAGRVRPALSILIYGGTDMPLQDFSRAEAAALLPRRPADMHKGRRGRLLVVGGSVRYPGAPALSALAALRTGGGVVSLLSSPAACAACAARLPEVVFLPGGENWAGSALAEAPSFAAAVVGPGLGRSPDALDTVRELWIRWPKPLLMDGDGLFALTGPMAEACFLRGDAVLTPHEGEAARLLGTTAEAVRADRLDAARRLADRWGCVLLKGSPTIVARRGEKTARRLDWGGPELSVPGSGDVLSGCIGALLAAGLTACDAALLGAALHGMAGARLRVGGVDGVLASEIADALRPAMEALRS